MQKHDIHDYMISAQHRIEDAYVRIRKHSSDLKQILIQNNLFLNSY